MDPAGTLVLSIVAAAGGVVIVLSIALFVVLCLEGRARSKLAAKRAHTAQEQIFNLHI
jgi:hypothetical protein